MTSLVLHTWAPLVCYSLRWLDATAVEGAPLGPSDSAIRQLVGNAAALYAFWQAQYLLKTEVLDRHRFEADPEIMTSLRWLADVRPHPIYKRIRAAGVRASPLVVIVVVQATYTLATLAVAAVAYSSRRVHTALLLGVLSVALWTGASHYFSAFVRSYVVRLERTAAVGHVAKDSALVRPYSLAVFAVFAGFYVWSFRLLVATAMPSPTTTATSTSTWWWP